ncbi:hypothetical protein D3C72_2448080 [compost metagenome]
MVTNIAEIWLRVNVEASSPNPVDEMMNTSAVSASVAKLPLSGTSNTVTASAVMSRKLNMASTM